MTRNKILALFLWAQKSPPKTFFSIQVKFGAVINSLTQKQQAFNQAMARYNKQPVYELFSKAVAVTSILLQLILVLLLFRLPASIPGTLLAFVVAYFLADLINGAIHLIMDHYDNYRSVAGPLVAQFHLHHKTPRYERKPLPLIYFHETGAKIWLSVYLLLVLLLMQLAQLPVTIIQILVFVGILSSVAEVSHYLCHTSKSPVVDVLSRLGILLSKRHHAEHHARDNTNYAFLNGWSDPVLNLIARKYFSGYKDQTDRHYAHYHISDPNRR